MFSSRNMYAIILAGDEDMQLAPLARALSIASVPRQYALIAGEGSLLQQTVAFYASLLPPEQIVVVVATKWKELARAQLRKWRDTCVVARPRNRGSAVDVMLGLRQIMACDPHATVVMAPADAYVPHARALVAPLAAAETALSKVPVILAGVPMNHAVLGDRLVVPGPPLTGRVRSVRRLVEHLPPEQVQRFKAKGALWDTSIYLARAATLWPLVAQQLPAEVAAGAGLGSDASPPRSSVQAAYRRTRVGQLATRRWQEIDGFGVIAVRGSGWSAWTTPQQVMDSLRDPHELEQLLSRIYQHQHGIDRAQLRRRFRHEAMQRPASTVCIAR